MSLKQLTYPSHQCVRCHRLTHEPRLCGQCRQDDEIVTRMSANALRFAQEAFSHRLGYQHSRLDRRAQ